MRFEIVRKVQRVLAVVVVMAATLTLVGVDVAQAGPTTPVFSPDLTYASNVLATTATLNTTVNPEGTATTFTFCYSTSSFTPSGSTCAGTTVTPVTSSSSSSTALQVSANITSLTAGTRYFFAAGATQGNTTTWSNVATFMGTTGGPLVCSATLYEANGGYLYAFDATTDTFTKVDTTAGTNLNGIGFNTQNDYIYGWSGSNLYEVDAAGVTTEVTASTYSNISSIGADFLPDSSIMVTENGSGSFYLDDVTSPTQASATMTTTSGSATFSGNDIAFNLVGSNYVGYGWKGTTFYQASIPVADIPLNSALWGSTSFANIVNVVQVTGNTANSNTPGTGDTFGSAYQDSSGDVFFFDNTNSKMYEVPASTLATAFPSVGTAGSAISLTYLASATPSFTGSTDGASCVKAGSAFAPQVITSSASSVTSSAVNLSASLSANGSAISAASFYYSTSSATATSGELASPTAATATVSGGLPTSASAAGVAATGSLTGLLPGTTYYYQAAATNGTGTNYGNVVSFTTSATAPAVTTVAASSLSQTSATLNATLTANGAATTVTFCYASTNTTVTGALQNCLNSGPNGATTGSPTLAGDTGVAATYSATGLTAGQTYYFQAIGTNSVNTTYGSVLSFTTPAISNTAPTITGATITDNGAGGGVVAGPVVGDVLSAHSSGVTGNPTPTETYQWYCDQVFISGATSSTYTVTSGDIGCQFQVVITESNTVNPNASLLSAPTGVAVAASAAPTITGATITDNGAGGGVVAGPVVGDVLSAHSSGVTGNPTPTETYQWYCSSSLINGATSLTYSVRSADLGCQFQVVITESNGVNPDASWTSVDTGVTVAASVAPTITSATITDNGAGGGSAAGPRAGDVLSAHANGVSGNPTPTPTFQWYCNNSPITGAVLSTLTVLSGNVGCAFTVSITESNSVNPSAYATSAPTGVEALALVAPGITGATVTDSGSGSGNLVGPLPGDVLTVVASGVSGNPAPTASYQWYCNNSPITGAVLSTFTVLSGNEGCVITVTITESNGVDPSAHATSAPTGAVNKPPKIDERILRVTSLKGVVGTALTLTSSGGSGTGPVTYRVLDGTATGCSISAGQLRAATSGTCVVTATKASDPVYNSIDSSATSVTMIKRDQSPLAVTSLKGVVGTALTLTSSGGSGTGPVTYRVLDGTATGCSISSGHLSASTAGTCVVTATKAGDATYNSIDSTPGAVSERAAAPQHAFYIVGNFVTGSSVLTASMQQRLQTIVRTIGSRHFERVSIRGYSSLPGALSSNVTLSQARATSAYVYVTALLRRDGISGVVVTFTGAGLGSSPITLNNQMVTLNCRS